MVVVVDLLRWRKGKREAEQGTEMVVRRGNGLRRRRRKRGTVPWWL